MATLATNTIASTYTMLLKMKDTGVDADLNKVESGDADDCALSLATAKIGIDTTDTLHFDGANGDFSASNTYIYESAADIMDFIVGGVHLLSLDDSNSEVVINEGSADVDFRVEGNNSANAFSVNGATDKVGIGTAGGTNHNLEVSGYSSQDCSIFINAVSARDAFLYLGANGSALWSIYNDATGLGGGNNTLVIKDDGDPRMVITQTGNVGIGTTSPENLLHVEGSSATIQLEASNNTGSVELLMYADQAADNADKRKISVADGGTMSFATYSSGSWVDQMAILDSGNVGIGVVPGVKLHVAEVVSSGSALVKFENNQGTVADGDTILLLSFNGDDDATAGHFIEFQDQADDEMTGTIVASSGTATNNTVSDYRKKENISLITGGLTKINALKPSYFNFITYPDAIHQGFIAHEVVEAGIGYAVRGEKDAMKIDNRELSPTYGQEVRDLQSFAITNIIPQMVSAIQELSAKVIALENA